MQEKQETGLYYFEDGIGYDNDDFYVWGAVLYDANTNEVSTTTYGHGMHYDPDHKYQEIWPALRNSGVDARKVVEALYKKIGDGTPSIDTEYRVCPQTLDIVGTYGLPVVVDRGKKIKGKCRIISKCFNYTYDIFGRKSGATVDVYSEETNRICTVDCRNCRIDEETLKTLKEYRRNNILSHTDIDFIRSYAHLLAYRMSYYSCDRDNYCYQIGQLAGRNCEKIFGEVVVRDDAKNPWEEARLMKRALKYKEAYIEQKLNIRDWAERTLASYSEEAREKVISRTISKWCGRKGLDRDVMEKIIAE